MKQASLLGLAIGDALGQPFEFLQPASIVKTGWQGDFINRNVKRERNPGDWTDDTKMALCIADSIVSEKKLNPEDIAKRYVEWYRSGDLRGIGIRCESSIMNLVQGVSYLESGKKENSKLKPTFKTISDANLGDFCGNGTVMRVAPIGIAFHKDRQLLKEAAHADATITHDHADARDASWAVASIIADIIEGADISDAIFAAMELDFEYNHVPTMMLKGFELAQEDIDPFAAAGQMGSRGTAHQTLGTAVYAIFKEAEVFHPSLVTSILMGGDTDTRAAIVGAILGAKGIDTIPKFLVEQVEDTKRLQDLDKKLMKAIK